jgi:hypothetical protein
MQPSSAVPLNRSEQTMKRQSGQRLTPLKKFARAHLANF